MKKFIKSMKGRVLLNDNGELQAPKGWIRGMTMCNASGDVDSSSLGFDYAKRTTTFLRAKAIKQKFYEVPIADFMPVEVGEGAWMEEISQAKEFSIAGAFEDGVIKTGSDSVDMPSVQAGMSPKKYPLYPWAKGGTYNVIEVEKALASNNWDAVQAVNLALKKNWTLGIQKVAFLGSAKLSKCYGLLTLPDVTLDTATLASNISALDPEDFQAFVATILGLYNDNSNGTQLPNRFVIPQDDMLGLSAFVNPAYPVKTKLEALTEAFKAQCGADFKILGLKYAQADYNKGIISVAGAQRYALYHTDPEVIRISLPVDFNMTTPGTNDNFNWKFVGFGQFSGAQTYRENEIYYLSHPK